MTEMDANTSPHSKIMNVLIIGDSTDTLSFFVKSLVHSCLVCNDGKEGCDLARKENFDLILLDISSPEFSGYGVLNMLKNDSDFDMKKIVVITGSGLGNLGAERIESLGIFKLVRKPISFDLLHELFFEFTYVN